MIETHPALTVLPWEHTEQDRYGVHGIAVSEQSREADHGPVTYRYECYCGHQTKPYTTRERAFAALVRHAERADEVARRPGARMTARDEPGITWLIVATPDGLRVVGDHDWTVRTFDEVEAMLGRLTPARPA